MTYSDEFLALLAVPVVVQYIDVENRAGDMLLFSGALSRRTDYGARYLAFPVSLSLVIIQRFPLLFLPF